MTIPDRLRAYADGACVAPDELLKEAADEIDRLRGLYEELLFAAGSKCPGETRHQTALRYIQQAETPEELIEAALLKAHSSS